jgi:FMN phosphatase YigB (HAD superfamily)
MPGRGEVRGCYHPIVGNAAIGTVFVDVGGTLLPNALLLTPALRESRARALCCVLGSDPSTASSVIERVEAMLPLAAGGTPDRVIATVLSAEGFDAGTTTVRLARQALQVSLSNTLVPFDHAAKFLSGIKDLGLRCIILSNTTFMDAELYRGEFEVFGWAGWVDGYVTSVDADCSKPGERIFRYALEMAGSSPDVCVMVGNSEDADIVPAIQFGMRALLVAIEDPVPAATAAGACAQNLEQALDVLRRWARAEDPGVS